MRFSRWTNPSLPQTLQYGIFLLYINAGIAMLFALGLPLGLPPYAFLAKWIADVDLVNDAQRFNALVSLVVMVSAAAYAFAGLMIANEQRRGWSGGVAVAVGGVAIPLLAVGARGFGDLGFIIGFMFDVALLLLLVHPQSRDYQRIWFE